MNDITIRRAETPADFQALQQAQRITWGIQDEALILPIASMVAANHFGGLVLGAFQPTGEAVALSFAFLGRIDGRLVLYSQLTGVIPTHQSLGLGKRLKEAQRDFCRNEGIPTIAWAFDPFQPGNARFNLNKLGATCGQFVENMYGPRNDALNAGMPTDRLIAEWDVNTEIDLEGAPQWEDALPIVWLNEASGKIEESRVDANKLAIEIPDAMSNLIQRDAIQATEWRAAVRRAFIQSFANGYRAKSITSRSHSAKQQRRHAYVLAKQ